MSGEPQETGSDRPGWVCTGCGKHVSGTIPVDVCADCGGEWVEATPDRLACEGCGAEDASRVLNSEHNRLCEDCIRRENSIPVDALEELRKEWEQAARGSTSGRALGLETAADELRVLVEEHNGLPEEDDEPEIATDGGVPSSPAVQAAAAAKVAKRRLDDVPNTVLNGHRIGECPDCDERFEYGGVGDDVQNLDPCPNCGSRSWHKWGYRYGDREVRRDEAWDRYDAPPTAGGDRDV